MVWPGLVTRPAALPGLGAAGSLCVFVLLGGLFGRLAGGKRADPIARKAIGGMRRLAAGCDHGGFSWAPHRGLTTQEPCGLATMRRSAERTGVPSASTNASCSKGLKYTRTAPSGMAT